MSATTLPVVTRMLAAPFAAIAPVNAIIANAAGMTSDVIAWLLVALVGGIVVACMTPIIRRQRRAEEAERRRRAREYREQWFGSFDRRQRVKGARAVTLRSTARDAYHVALDFWGCIRRFVDGKAVNGYDDHMAEVLADDAGKRAGRDLADALAEGKSRNEYLGPYESPENFAEAIERECDCGTCAAISRDREQRCDEAAERPRVSPPTRASGHPTFPNWCAAEMHQLADILARCDEPFALGYANDLRHAAMEASGDPGQPRVLWPWSNEDERQK